MKTKIAILSGLVVVGAGIWYLFLRQEPSEEQENTNPVEPIHKEDSHQNHLREILHKAKTTVVEPERSEEVLTP